MLNNARGDAFLYKSCPKGQFVWILGDTISLWILQANVLCHEIDVEALQ